LIARILNSDRRGAAGDVWRSTPPWARPSRSKLGSRPGCSGNAQHHCCRVHRRGPIAATGAWRNHQTQCTGPERLDEFRARAVRHRVDQAVDRVPRTHQNGDGHVAGRAPFADSRAATAAPSKRVGPDSIDGVGGQHDEAAALQRAESPKAMPRLPAACGIGAFEHFCHASTPARSGPRSYLAAIPHSQSTSGKSCLDFPLAPVLARTSLRSSLAVDFGEIMPRLPLRSGPRSYPRCDPHSQSTSGNHASTPRSLRSSLVPRCDPHSQSTSGNHASTPRSLRSLARTSLRSSLASRLREITDVSLSRLAVTNRGRPVRSSSGGDVDESPCAG